MPVIRLDRVTYRQEVTMRLYTAALIAALLCSCDAGPSESVCTARGNGSIQCTGTFDACVGVAACAVPAFGIVFSADGTYQQTYPDGISGGGTWRVTRTFDPSQVLITNQSAITAVFSLYEYQPAR